MNDETKSPGDVAGCVDQMIGEMRNFADVADGCQLTEGNASTVIRLWADRLSTLTAGVRGEACKPFKLMVEHTDLSFSYLEGGTPTSMFEVTGAKVTPLYITPQPARADAGIQRRIDGALDRLAYYCKDNLTRLADVGEIRRLIGARADAPAVVDGLAARRWNALVNSGRIRVLGSAGLHSDRDLFGKPWDGYAHIGLEFWTRSDTENTPPDAVQWLTKYVDTMLTAAPTPPVETEQSIKADAYDMIAEALLKHDIKPVSVVDYVTRLIHQPNAGGMAIKMLVAAGWLTEAKASEALNIAHGFECGPLPPTEARNQWVCGHCGAANADDCQHIPAPTEAGKDGGELLRRIATECWAEWDEGNESRVGKILRALADPKFGATYRADIAELHAILAGQPQGGHSDGN